MLPWRHPRIRLKSRAPTLNGVPCSPPSNTKSCAKKVPNVPSPRLSTNSTTRACITAAGAICPSIPQITNTTVKQDGPAFGRPKMTRLAPVLIANSLWCAPNATAAAADRTWATSLTMDPSPLENAIASTESAWFSERPNHFLSKNIRAAGCGPWGRIPFNGPPYWSDPSPPNRYGSSKSIKTAVSFAVSIQSLTARCWHT